MMKSLGFGLDSQLPALDTAADDSDEMVWLRFKLGSHLFCTPVEHIQEVIRPPKELTRVPNSPEWLIGLMNLRGCVLPVASRPLYCHPDIHSATEETPSTRILVCFPDGPSTGLRVDEVLGVLKKSTEDSDTATLPPEFEIADMYAWLLEPPSL
jgi:purine-binding chemotaxis protein CheW